MLLHFDEFFVRVRAGLAQQPVGNADFADIVQRRVEANPLDKVIIAAALRG